MYDEAAKDLPKLSTAKAFWQAIAKRKQLKDSQEDRTSSGKGECYQTKVIARSNCSSLKM
jgi:hypothetical protein